MASCTAQDLVNLTPALNGIPLGLVSYAQLAVLCKILQATDPMATCSASELVENAKCLSCSVPPGLVQFASLYLLCQIEGGGTISTDFLVEYANPAALPATPADPTKVWLANFRDGSAGKWWSPTTLNWY